jgi:hypothetical protein
MLLCAVLLSAEELWVRSIGCQINFQRLVPISIHYGPLMLLTAVKTEQIRHQ